MRLVTSVSNIKKLHSANIPLPEVLVDFIILILSILREKIGIPITVEVPTDSVASEQDLRIRSVSRYLQDSNIITYVREERRQFDDEPFFYGVIAEISGRKRMSYSGYGKSLISPVRATWAALGEALERWSLDHYEPKKRECISLTTQTLKSKYNLDLLKVAGFSTKTRAQTKQNRNYFLSKDSVFTCIKVKDVLSQKYLFAPLQWFSFLHAARATDRRIEPVISPITSNGAATGVDYNDAVYRAMLELIERDAFMLHWTNGIVPSRIDLGTLNSEVALLVKQIAEKYQLEVHLLYLKTDFPVHVVQAVVVDKTGIGPAVLCNSACGPEIDSCIERAVLGALGLRPHIRKQLKKNLIQIPSEISKLTMETRALWWANPNKIASISEYLSGLYIGTKDLAQYRLKYKGTNLLVLCDKLRQLNYMCLAKIISPTHVQKNTNLVTVMVKIPELLPLHFDEWEGCDFGSRLEEVPKLLKLTKKWSVGNLPHPYAQYGNFL